MKQYVCGICGYIHDEAVGGKWEDLPPIGSVLSVKQAKTLSNPKKKKQRPRRSLKSPMWTRNSLPWK